MAKVHIKGLKDWLQALDNGLDALKPKLALHEYAAFNDEINKFSEELKPRRLPAARAFELQTLLEGLQLRINAVEKIQKVSPTRWIGRL